MHVSGGRHISRNLHSWSIVTQPSLDRVLANPRGTSHPSCRYGAPSLHTSAGLFSALTMVIIGLKT